MRFAALALAVCLSACTFDSPQPFFTDADGGAPFEKGARFDFLEHPPGAEENEDSEIPQIEFRQQGGGYALIGNDQDDAPMSAIFFAINDTAEEDYIVQIALEAGESGRVYAFVWRSGDAYKVIVAPGAFEPDSSALDRYCTRGLYGACGVANREALIALYREAIYPTFVAPDVKFHGLGYLVPAQEREHKVD